MILNRNSSGAERTRNLPATTFKLSLLIFCHILLHAISIQTVQAEETDSIRNDLNIQTIVRYIHLHSTFEGPAYWSYPDSTLTKVSDIDKSKSDLFNALGTYGSALNSKWYKQTQNIYAYSGLSAYAPYLWTPDSLKFYRTNKRYSEITFHNATFKDQSIRLLHSQNILKTWSAGFDFHRLGVRDYTINSDTYHNQFSFFTWYESVNTRYQVFASAIWNVVKNQLNGGLKNDSLFRESNIDNLGLKSIGIKLGNANHRFRNHSFSVHNRYKTGKSSDSTFYKSDNSVQLIQSTTLESGSYAYSDAVGDSVFYKDFFKGAETYDSLHYYDLKNSAGIYFPRSVASGNYFRRNFSSTLEAEHQWFKYAQRDEQQYSNYGLKAKVMSPGADSLYRVHSDFSYVLAGEMQGNFHLGLSGQTPVFKAGKVFAGFNVQSTNPGLIYQNYFSNHFIWKNQFSKTDSRQWNVGFSNKRYKFLIEILFHQVKNSVYAGFDAKPEQHSGRIDIIQGKLFKDFSYRNFHLDNRIFIQNSNRNEVIPLPEYSGIHKLYFENVLFRNALRLQTGFQVNFSSSYYSEAFMPSSSIFYLQDEQKTGGYAATDFFIHLKIKSARIFFKIENIGDGIFGKSYTLTPEYPQAGRTLCFGLNWRFYDL